MDASLAKKPRLDNDAAGAIQSLNSANQEEELLEKMQALQEALNGLSERAAEQIVEIQRECIRARAPIHVARSKVLERVPQFWLQVLLNSPLGGLILPDDEEALQSIVDISVDEAADIESGFSIRFKFGANRFFRDAELVKRYTFDGDGEMTCTSTAPQWLPQQDLVAAAAGEIDQGEENGANVPSFFSFFTNDPWVLDDGQELGQLIKDELWLDPVRFYIGEADD